jgi:hypothetical protein
MITPSESVSRVNAFEPTPLKPPPKVLLGTVEPLNI